jgi:hypothetical protein
MRSSSTSTTARESVPMMVRIRKFFLWFSLRHIILLVIEGALLYYAFQPNPLQSAAYVDELRQGDIVYVRANTSLTMSSDAPFTVSTQEPSTGKMVSTESEESLVDNRQWLFNFSIQSFAMKVLTATAPINATGWSSTEGVNVETPGVPGKNLSTNTTVLFGLLLYMIWLLAVTIWRF